MSTGTNRPVLNEAGSLRERERHMAKRFGPLFKTITSSEELGGLSIYEVIEPDIPEEQESALRPAIGVDLKAFVSDENSGISWREFATLICPNGGQPVRINCLFGYRGEGWLSTKSNGKPVQQPEYCVTGEGLGDAFFEPHADSTGWLSYNSPW